jgi:hypothetical protein
VSDRKFSLLATSNVYKKLLLSTSFGFLFLRFFPLLAHVQQEYSLLIFLIFTHQNEKKTKKILNFLINDCLLIVFFSLLFKFSDENSPSKGFPQSRFKFSRFKLIFHAQEKKSEKENCV